MFLEVFVSTQAEDGETIFNFDSFFAKDLKDFPDIKTLENKIRQLAEKTMELREAEKLEEYAGPVIFTGQAAGAFFRQLFAANLAQPRSPLVGSDRFSYLARESKLARKIKRRILPDFMNIVDDPSLEEFDHTPLLGSFMVDDDGVSAERTVLVDKGKLLTPFMCRIPTKKIKQTNGHSRGGLSISAQGRPANLLVESKETTEYENLKKKLLEYCEDMDLENGIIVVKLRDKNFYLDTDPTTYITSAQREALLCEPIEAYKVYVKDGKEKLIRGLEFEGITVRYLKDIVQTSDDWYVYNFMLGNNYELPTSIVTPSILMEEMELKRMETKPQKPPILESPFAGN